MKKYNFFLVLFCFKVYGTIVKVDRLQSNQNTDIFLFSDMHDDQIEDSQVSSIINRTQNYISKKDRPLEVYIERPPFFNQDSSRGLGKIYDVMANCNSEKIRVKDCEVRHIATGLEMTLAYDDKLVLQDLVYSSGNKLYEISSLCVGDIKDEYNHLLSKCSLGNQSSEEKNKLKKVQNWYETVEAILKNNCLDDQESILKILDFSCDTKYQLKHLIIEKIFMTLFDLHLARKIIKKSKKYDIAAFVGFMHATKVKSILSHLNYKYFIHCDNM